ncbi:unnamed protein product [Paramecium pentaurelia]|uniref:Serine aminopeptidase S33 domain-containing protein n=1 Tax=Paramecium pentaurelia TaxID=43138 RepID=A0A8S1Y184_9CILI|nr:unnamed protein product [Paramecium pentaurelia]
MSQSCTEKLWKPIIRPPRHYYQLKDLGNQITMVIDTVTKRTDFEIVNKRKLTLQCSLFEPVRVQDRQHSCMIYLHGNSSSRVESLTILEYLIPYNIAVCGIDLSGSGHSEGVYISLGYYESQDVQSLIDYLRDHKPYITQIGLWGRSMGSVTAILSASQNEDIKVLVCDSPFSNLALLCKEIATSGYGVPGCCFNCFFCFVKSKIRKEANFNVDDLNIIQIVGNLSSQVSIAFLSANQDQLVNSKHSKQLHCVFKGTKLLKSFDGQHNSKRPNDIMKEVADFVISQLGKQSSDQPQSSRDTKLLLLHNQREKISFQYDEVHPIMTGGQISNNEQNITK